MSRLKKTSFSLLYARISEQNDTRYRLMEIIFYGYKKGSFRYQNTCFENGMQGKFKLADMQMVFL